MLSKELLDILACPSCKGDLVYDQKTEKCENPECGHIAETTVKLKYSIKDDIPIMLINEAEKF